MKIKKIKFIALFVISSMLLLLILACGDDSSGGNVPANNEPAQQQDGDGSASQPDEPAEAVKLLPNVPEDLNLGGYSFRLLYELSGGNDWAVSGITAEAENGDPVNDAAYLRNMYVTDKYNFEIISTQHAPYAISSSIVRRSVQAGADDWDAVITRQLNIGALVTSGSLVDFNHVPGLEFDGPWWDRAVMDQMTVSNRKFMAFGDFIVSANDALRILMFNKELHQNAGLEDIYSIVKEGKWTLDVFYEMSKDISLDLNGDGIMDTRDRYGLLLQRGSVVCFMFGAGETITAKDENDIPVVVMGGERSMLVLQKIWDVVNTPELAIFDSEFPNAWADLQPAFENGQGLFFGEVLQLAERMRATDTEFGVIPFPKYDEIQENYYAYADSHCMNFIIIPSTNRNLAQTGQILEILNAESYYTARPAYYEKSLQGKFMRDEESSEMLDIILSNKFISLDETFGWGMHQAMVTVLTGRSPDFVSTIEGREERTALNIQRTIDSILDLE